MPHSSFMLFFYWDHLTYAAYILRVLSQETLEASKEVKDSSVPGPSLAKEVKDSSLTILLQFSSVSEASWGSKLQLWGFLCRTGVHCLGKKNSLGTKNTRSGGDLTSKVFVITRVPFLICLGRVFLTYLFIFIPGRIYWRRAHLWRGIWWFGVRFIIYSWGIFSYELDSIRSTGL